MEYTYTNNAELNECQANIALRKVETAQTGLNLNTKRQKKLHVYIIYTLHVRYMKNEILSKF